MMKTLPFSYFLLICILIPGCFSQGIAQNGIMDFGISYNKPLGEFQSDGYKEGVGFNFGMYSKAMFATNGLAAVRFGGRMNFDFSGRSEGELIAPLPDTDYYGEMHLENSSMGFLGAVRIESTPIFPVQLYLEGLMGARSLMTTESFNEHDSFEEAECIESTILRSWNLAYGASAGTLIRLGKRTKLDIRATYLSSTPSNFVNLSTAQQVEDNLYQYQTEKAPVNQFQIQAGLSFDVDFRCAPTRSSLASNMACCFGESTP